MDAAQGANVAKASFKQAKEEVEKLSIFLGQTRGTVRCLSLTK